VREICRRLDCLPLAVELVAARARELTPAEMRGMLAGRLQLASQGPRDLPARQQTLHATIEWSYELLDEGEQQLFAGLGVFAGGCTSEAAIDVCDADSATLATLAEKSLLVRHDGRYAMLETIREYALERLRQEHDEVAVRRRHGEYFVDLGVLAKPALDSEETAAWLDRLDAELDNLRSALEWSLEHEPEAFVRVVDALYQFWYIRGHYREGLRWYDRARTVADADPSARADVIKRGAALAYACGEFTRARSMIDEALVRYRKLGDISNSVRALTLLGLIATNEGRHEEAIERLEEGTALARETDDEDALAFALSNLGYAAVTAGDAERAYSASLEAVELNRGQASQQLGTALGNLGCAALLLGRLAEARERLGECVSIKRSLQEALGLASAFIGFAAIAVEEGAFARAARLLGAADALFERTDADPEPFDAKLYERTAAAACGGLGDEQFAKECDEGRSLALDEAAAFALEEVEPAGERG
jgi:tetratricopeptide (TPR) repeat protein